MNSTTPSEQGLVRSSHSNERKNPNNQHSSRVCAVVVTFCPNLELLIKVLDRLRTQVANVIVVDNTPTNREVSSLEHTQIGTIAEVIALGLNQGIAAAHNVGMQWAREHDCTHVLLIDHDSIAAPDMVARLLEGERELKRRGERVAAVAPRIDDKQYPKATAFIRQEGLRRRRISCGEDTDQYIRCDYVVSSGALIAMEVLETIGEMDETLFIDYVDIEWGLRAQSKGFDCFGVCNTTLEHRLGDAVATIPLIKGFYAPVRSSLRHYYHFRNAIHLYKRSYIPLAWAINDAYRLLLKYIFYATVTPPRWQHLKMMTLGIWHGLWGRIGPFEPAG